MARRLERLSLYVLLAVVALRPLIGESYQTGQTSVSAALSEVTGPMPARTLAIDAAILAAALLWLVGRTAGNHEPYRHCGIEWGAMLAALAGIVSCRVAGNQRAAINATVDWLCLPVLTVVLVQLLRHRWQVRLALGVVLASGTVQAYQCFRQVCYEFPVTQRWYEEHKAQMWAAANVEPDSLQVTLHERRVYAREATGFLTHSNVTGAYLVMTGLAALAFAWTRWKSPPKPFRRLFAGAVGVLAVGMLGAAVCTRSKGALAAGGLALVLGLVAWQFRPWLASRRSRALLLGWALVVAAGVATVGYGVIRGGLPGASLNFRWQYWAASWRLFGDSWGTGVGRENFAARYLAYKDIAAPEEVSNPHNFLVGGATEWGVLGGAGLLAMLVGGSIVATRRPPRLVGGGAETGGRWLLWGPAVCAGAFGVRLFLLGTANEAYLIDATVLPVIVWMAAFAALSTESNRGATLFDDPLPGLATLVNFALLAFLLQDTINFALFVPGAATTFFALLAVPIAWRRAAADAATTGAVDAESGVTPRGETGSSRRFSGRRATAWLAAVLGGLVLVGHVTMLLVPVARSNAALSLARRSANQIVPGGYRVQSAYAAYVRAAEADPLDPTPCAEAAGYLIGYAEAAGEATAPLSAADAAAALAAAFEMIDAAIQRHPHSTTLQHQKLRMCARAHAVTNDERYLQRALEPAGRIVELYPQSPDAQADLGTALLDAGRASRDDKLLSQAVDHLRRALELDDARPEWEELRRMPARQREEIEARIVEALVLLGAEGK